MAMIVMNMIFGGMIGQAIGALGLGAKNHEQ